MKALHEAIADIAYIAGQHGYYSGDSRADIQEFVALAKEFEKLTKRVDWDSSQVSYIEAIEIWIVEELHLVKKLDFTPEAAKHAWDNIEVNGCIDEGDAISAVHSEEDGTPDFYSVYLHQVTGGVNCIADLPTEEDARALADLIKNAVHSYKDNGYLPKDKNYSNQ